MKDPYHNARLRFKVARDRLIERQLIAHKSNRARRQRLMMRRWTCSYFANEPLQVDRPGLSFQDYSTMLLRNEVTQAAYILRTMQTYKLTDEKQAHMLWKLSRT